MVTVTQILDLISEALIQSEFVDVSVVRANQKTIKNGRFVTGRGNNDRLIVFESTERSNREDLNSSDIIDGNSLTLQGIVDLYNDLDKNIEDIQVTVSPGGDVTISSWTAESPPLVITNLVTSVNQDGTVVNPLNVGEFINIEKKSTIINTEQAEEYLDTNIYELLPRGDNRQERINKIYSELNVLLPPPIENFDEDGDQRVDRNPDNPSEWIGSEQYYLDNSISAAQTNPSEANIEEESAFITRLTSEASPQNSGKTIQDFRDLLTPYLRDIDEKPDMPTDERGEYTNQSSGYLKFRNLNQGIIVRNTNQEFIEGLNPTTLDYLETGFTITMWVRFLDKVSTGTLFNFGNPERGDNPTGFKLETLVADDNRYLRLLVYNNNENRFYDSHIGNSNFNKIDSTTMPIIVPDFFLETQSIDQTIGQVAVSQYLQVPTNFDEWYFICATYNPDIDEISSDLTHPLPDYWMNNWNPVEVGDVGVIGATWDGLSGNTGFNHPPAVNGEYTVVDSNYDVLMTTTGITTLNMDDVPKLENGKLDAFLKVDIFISDINFYPDRIEITDTDGLNDTENAQGFRKSLNTDGSIPIDGVNGNGEWQLGVNTITAYLGDNSDGGYVTYMDAEHNAVSQYEGPYNFDRVQVQRSDPTGDGVGSQDAQIKFTNFRIEYMESQVLQEGSYTANSELGNRCKVEIISRTDLFRARGLKV